MFITDVRNTSRLKVCVKRLIFQHSSVFYACTSVFYAWTFSYIVIHRRCPYGLIARGQQWIKSFLFPKSFSPSAIPDNRLSMNCDIWKPGLNVFSFITYDVTPIYQFNDLCTVLFCKFILLKSWEYCLYLNTCNFLLSKQVF